MTTGSLAEIYNIPMRKLGYSDFAIQTEKLAARLILSCLLFPYPAIIQHCTVQKYPAFFVLSLEFTLRDHHILLVLFMNYSVLS